MRMRILAATVNATVAVLGLSFALGGLEVTLRMQPNWVPSGIRVSPPVRRVNALVDETYEVKLSSGNLYSWMKGAIASVPARRGVVLDLAAQSIANHLKGQLADDLAVGDSNP